MSVVCSKSANEAGFILPLVLWAVVAMTLAAAVIAQWISNAVESTHTRQLDSDAEIELFSAQSMVIYDLTTQYISIRGLELAEIDINRGRPTDPFAELAPAARYLSLADSPYLFGQVTVRIQDTRGLINLNLAQDDEIFRLLGVYGIPIEARGPLIAKLRDYSDSSNLVRLNGAKAPQYEAAGKPIPRQEPLITPWESKRVLDWDKYPRLWNEQDGIAAATTTSRTIGLNLNTAPASVLSLIEGMNPAAVDKIVRGRQISPAKSIADLAYLSGVAIPDDPLKYVFFPSDTFRVRLSAKTRPLERVVVIQLTPQQLNQPWRLDYTVDVPPLSTNVYDSDQTINFPTPTLAAVGK